MERHVWAVCLGVAAVLACAVALATGTGEADSQVEEPDDAVVLGEEDLADRAEILRNMYRRITPPDVALVQDVGTWPAAWEVFGASWEAAAADREYGAWVVPIEVTQDAGATVVRDGNGAVLWRDWTDFARPESADVILTGGLVAEEEWAVYEGVRDAVVRLGTAGGTPAPPVRSNHANGLRFTSHEWTSNGTFRLGLAYEIDTDVDVFAYAVACTSSLVVATWTNDENQVVTDTNTAWTAFGLPFNGMESDWELRGTVAISNGVAEFEDSGFSEELSRLRFYAAAVAEDTDGDGLNDGWEDFVSHTSPSNQDSDGDGVPDGMDTMPATSNVWFEVVTANTRYYREVLDDCGLNAPKQTNWSDIVYGHPPTSDSVLRDVGVSGYVDDAIMVDGHEVNADRGPQSFSGLSITNYMLNPQSAQFELKLLDWPAADYAGPNEVRLGSSQSNPFLVEWVWGVPMALTGPECVCVGDTAQFEAAGAGGGPYTWSVAYEGATPVGEINENGMFTALAPGLATVTATAGEVYSVSQAVNVVQIEFLAGGGNTSASSLKIGKWENAFTVVGTNVTVKDNFIDLDPDRFRVRVTDLSQAGEGIISIGLSTSSDYPDPSDNPTGIELHEEAANSGIFISTNLLLVADDIDDDFSNSQVNPDDTGDDRTHRISLGGKVYVQYPWVGTTLAVNEISVEVEKTLHVIPIIMKGIEGGAPLISASQVGRCLAVARERFAQVGIDLTWDAPEIRDPPTGMTLTNTFLVRDILTNKVLSTGAKLLLEEVGTSGNTNDLCIVFLKNPKAGDTPLMGSSVADYYYDDTENAYLFNVVINSVRATNTILGGYAIAHELGHLLRDAGHTNYPWRVMYPTAQTGGVVGSRRFSTLEETKMQGDSHVH